MVEGRGVQYSAIVHQVFDKFMVVLRRKVHVLLKNSIILISQLKHQHKLPCNLNHVRPLHVLHQVYVLKLPLLPAEEAIY